MASNAAQPSTFGPLLSQHVKTILESGLLLDEDYEVLLNASNFKIYPTKSFQIPFRLIAGSLATFGSVFIARKYCQPIIALPPVAATIILLYFERSAAWKRNRRQAVVYHVVKSFIQLRKLNSTIRCYMEMRKQTSKEKDDFSVFNENIGDFVGFLVAQNKTFFKPCLEQLKYLAITTQDLSDDYKAIKELDVDSILATKNINSENYHLLITKVQDVYTFLTSKYLNYLGITFCKNLTNNNSNKLMEVLLDENLPFINAHLEQIHFQVQKEFNSLKYSASKKLEIDMLINRSCFAKQLSGKLQQTLVGAVNNLSLIMEKSRFVLAKVENMESDKELENFQSALGDLRDHALATYESLDILCKMYGMVSKAERQLEHFNSLPRESYTEEQSDMNMVSYNDTNEALEENYELYIPDDDSGYLHTVEAKERYEDQSAMYLSLMLKELRQSLKQHDRFIAARHKRGIKEDEDEDLCGQTTIAIPKFDLNAFKTKDEVTEKNKCELSNELPPIPPPRPSKNFAVPPLPPPPPPPPPDVIVHSDSKRTLFDSIKTLSSQLKVKEDIFGDECDSDGYD